MTFSIVSTIRLRLFDLNRPPHFFKNALWIWVVFAGLIKPRDRGVVKVSLLAWFKPDVHKNHFGELKRFNLNDCGVCFVQRLLFRDKLMFKVLLNLRLDIGRHACSQGWTKNPVKLEKFKRSDQADCGFGKLHNSLATHKKLAKSIFQTKSTGPLL